MDHAFILQPGTWLGEGKISFNNSSESIVFYTKWDFKKDVEGSILATQEVEMRGVEEKVRNEFVFSSLDDTSFVIQLENEDVGIAMGKGVIDESNIAWEFRDPGGFEGYEVFKRTKDDEYEFHAEYASTDQFRTIIDGRIWKKTN